MDYTLALMKEAGIEPTLDDWLTCNLIDPYGDDLDAELLLNEVPQQFEAEFMDRLRLLNEYETKFKARSS